MLFHTQLVMLGRHGFVPFGGVFAYGDKGVDLFFVLSGFIMMHVHRADLGRPERLLPYLYSRVCRIYPSVWIVSFAALAVYLVGFDAAKAQKLDPGALLASFLLLPQSGQPLVNVTWTLVHEMFFYGLFGLLLLHRTWGLIALVVWQAIVVVLMVRGVDTDTAALMYVRPIALEFGVGIAVALLAPRLSAMPQAGRLGAALLVAGIVLFVGFAAVDTYVLPGWRWPLPRALTYGPAGGLIVLGCVVREHARGMRVPSVLVRLGAASYSIYLLHFSIVRLAVGALPAGQVSALVAIACALAVSLAFHSRIDRPITSALAEFGRPWTRRRSAAPLDQVAIQASAKTRGYSA